MPAMKKRFENLTSPTPQSTRLRGEYRDPFSRLSPAQVDQYRGKLVAVSSRTGEIIGAADSESELIALVSGTGHSVHSWRIVQGPPTTPALSLDEMYHSS
jgi:hypothetical protein